MTAVLETAPTQTSPEEAKVPGVTLPQPELNLRPETSVIACHKSNKGLLAKLAARVPEYRGIPAEQNNDPKYATARISMGHVAARSTRAYAPAVSATEQPDLNTYNYTDPNLETYKPIEDIINEINLEELATTASTKIYSLFIKGMESPMPDVRQDALALGALLIERYFYMPKNNKSTLDSSDEVSRYQSFMTRATIAACTLTARELSDNNTLNKREAIEYIKLAAYIHNNDSPIDTRELDSESGDLVTKPKEQEDPAMEGDVVVNDQLAHAWYTQSQELLSKIRGKDPESLKKLEKERATALKRIQIELSGIKQDTGRFPSWETATQIFAGDEISLELLKELYTIQTVRRGEAVLQYCRYTGHETGTKTSHQLASETDNTPPLPFAGSREQHTEV